MKRRYGFYYDLQEVTTISFDDDSRESHLITGMLDESLMDKDEKLFQQLWKTYFKAICIKERMNPRKHRQDMPVRYWKYLTEKQSRFPFWERSESLTIQFAAPLHPEIPVSAKADALHHYFVST